MSLLKKIQDKYGAIHEIGDSRVDAFETELTGGEHNVPYSPAVLSKTNAIEQKIDDHTSNLANPHKVTKEQLGLANVENKSSSQIRSEITKENITNALGYTPIDESKIGAANGVASLDSSGRIPASQIPGGFDNIEEYDTLKSFPAKGEEGKIYVAKDTNLTYRWTGSQYVEISPSIALGETSKTAYRGDRGKIAYEHSQITGNTSIHHTHANKVLLDSYTQTEADLANAVAKVHEHGNKTVLDGITANKVESWNSKMDKQTVGNVSEPVYIENGIAKIATNVATTGNLEAKLNVDGSNATTAGVTTMMKKVPIGSDYLDDNSYYFGDIYDHTQIIRRPILNIWNYIKNKVQSQLLGSVGSADKPIYLENGVPKVCADGIPYSSVSYGGNVGYGVFVGGAHNVAYNTRIYCTFLISMSSYPDNIMHTYIGTFSFRGGILNSELKCLTGTPAYPLRITTIYNEDGKDSNGKPTYTIGLYVIPADKTYKYSSYKLTRIVSDSDFIWDVKDISEATYDECNSVAKPALRPIILTWDAKAGNVTTTGGTWIPTFDKATIIDCRGIVDMSIQVDLSIIGQRTYIDTLTSYEITLVNSSKTDILPESLHQTGRMPRQAYSSSGTVDGTIDTSCTHRFIFPITSTTNLLAGYRPRITLPSNYPLDSGAQVNIKALCRGIVLPYGADEYF